MTKPQMIAEIKQIIQDWGPTKASELELEASPVLNSFGKNHFQLVEEFGYTLVTVFTYIHDTEVDQMYVFYEDLKDDILAEIHEILKKYDAVMSRVKKIIVDSKRTDTMSVETAIELVTSHNRWRRGAETEMQDPTELGVAMDTVLNSLRELLKQKQHETNQD